MATYRPQKLFDPSRGRYFPTIVHGLPNKGDYKTVIRFKTLEKGHTRAPLGSLNAAQPPPSRGLHPQHKNTLNIKLILYIQSYTYFYSHNLPAHPK